VTMTSSQDVYEIRPRKDRRGFDLIGERLPLGLLWFEGADAMGDAVNYARFFSRSHPAIIRVFDDSGMVAATLELVGDYSQNKQNACCVFLQATLNVHVNMREPNNGQALSTTRHNRPRYTGERLLRERPKVYRQIVRLLGEGWSANKICKCCHVTRETVRAVERREASEVSARKKSIVGILSNVAELGAGRMEET